MIKSSLRLSLLLLLALGFNTLATYSQELAISVIPVRETFVFEDAPFRECHASTIVELSSGVLLATWFGGTREKHPDVTIWLSAFQEGKWEEIRQAATGEQADGQRYPCWNPVLFQHSSGLIYLFYKVGPSPSSWWGEKITSSDEGKSWSAPERLPAGFFGPIRAKPLELPDGSLFCPSSLETPGGRWTVHFERYRPAENTWERIAVDDATKLAIIQPTLLVHESGKVLQLLCRSRQNRIVTSWSRDGGMTWSVPEITSLPNPSAGIDGVSVPGLGHFLVYNPTESGPADRAKLALAFSADGRGWQLLRFLENEAKGEFSYPALIRGRDGNLRITWTWNRRKIRFTEWKILP